MDSFTPNTETIILNECRNSGIHMHLYQNNPTGSWVAFGFSAFRLKSICEANNLGHVSEYSSEMQMPCVIVGNKEVAVVVEKSMGVSDAFARYFKLQADGEMSEEAYKQWASELRKF